MSDDDVNHCGEEALSLLNETDSEDALKLAHGKLYSVHFKDVPLCWRRLYTEASLWLAASYLKEDEMVCCAKLDSGFDIVAPTMVSLSTDFTEQISLAH
jgi:hypothetical protein